MLFIQPATVEYSGRVGSRRRGGFDFFFLFFFLSLLFGRGSVLSEVFADRTTLTRKGGGGGGGEEREAVDMDMKRCGGCVFLALSIYQGLILGEPLGLPLTRHDTDVIRLASLVRTYMQTGKTCRNGSQEPDLERSIY